MHLKKEILSALTFAFLVACSGNGSGDNPANGEVSSNLSSSVEGNSKNSSSSSSSFEMPEPCKTETEDNCEYGTLTDERDGQTYKTVKIGDQEWMAENLNFETENSSCYDHSLENCKKFGRLYSWSAAMDSLGLFSKNGVGCGKDRNCVWPSKVRGVCPEGWRLPHEGDIRWLVILAGKKDTGTYNLKSTEVWMDLNKGSDAFGFNALPGGRAEENARNFRELGEQAYFWLASEHHEFNLWPQRTETYLGWLEKEYQVSVRCIKGENSDKEATIKNPPEESSSSTLVFDVTEGSLTDERDGKTYRTVKIGDQEWMAENLNFETDGGICYNDSLENCNKYGRLYTWASAMDSVGAFSETSKGCGYDMNCKFEEPARGICPSGWHMPSNREWRELIDFVEKDSTVAIVLKSESGWPRQCNGTDAAKFTVLPAGYESQESNFWGKDIAAAFWEGGSSGGVNMINTFYFSYGGKMPILYSLHKYDHASIRCVKD